MDRDGICSGASLDQAFAHLEERQRKSYRGKGGKVADSRQKSGVDLAVLEGPGEVDQMGEREKDVVVPLWRIAELVACLPEYEARYGMKIYCFGHAGDGNIHINVTVDHPDARERVEKGIREILRKVLAIGGTMSGEHGVGIAKRPYLPLELSPESIRLQRAIKHLFNPNLILNPGKVFA